MFRRLLGSLALLLLLGVTASADAQTVLQQRGLDSRVDYADLTRFGPWDDRNYQLTATDLELLSRDEAEVQVPLPAFFRVALRRANPDLSTEGDFQYPLVSWQVFRKVYGGYLVDGQIYRRSTLVDGRYQVVMENGISVEAGDDTGEVVAKFLDGEVRVSSPVGSAESAVKIHPHNPDLVIAGANDVTVTQQMYRSTNGGDTWLASAALPSEADTCCDPTIDWSSDGDFAYTATLGSCGFDLCEVWFYRSDDNGATWNDLGNTPLRVSDTSGNDKEYLHVDKSPSSTHEDNLYLTWHDNNTLQFSRSTNFGATWSNPTALSSGTNERGIGSDITTDRNGNVYYFWAATDSRRILMRRSTNGGASFAGTRTVANTQASFIFPIPSMPNRQAFVYASADADVSDGPYSNRVYVAWTDTTTTDTNNPNTNHARIQVAYTTNGGTSWTVRTPHPTNDMNTVDRFHPWLAVGPDGVVHMVFYDTRRDATRQAVDLFYTSSANGGNTWSAPIRLTGQQSPLINDNFELGDYNGLDVVLNNLIAVYTDNRNEGGGTADSQDIYAIGIPAAGNCTNVPAGARAHFPLDETSGNTAVNPLGPNGTLTNGPQRVDGLADRGVDFDGSNDYIATSDSASFEFGTGDFSIASWVRTTDSYGMITAKRQFTGGKYVGYLFMVYNSRLLLQIGDTTNSWANYTSTAIPTINDGDWHHVAVTVDRNNTSGGRMYIDGELVYTFNPTGRQGNTSNSVALEIGRSTGGGSYLDGTLDEVMLFNRSLSQASVRDLYQAGANGVCPITPPSAALSCFGNFNGSTQVSCVANVNGGVPPYTYNWTYSGTADSSSSGGPWAYAYYFFGGCNTSDINFFFVTVTDGIGQTTNASLGPLTCF